MPRTSDLTVFITSGDSRCDECREDLSRHAWIKLEGDHRALCLACADLDHLVFLPRGDAALTRRARKHSRLSAVVVKWSRARKRYERQGLLVEDDALATAEAESEADAATRAARRERAQVRRLELDQAYVARFAARIRELYPHCPADREIAIAEHACRKYSGRVGRTRAAQDLEQDAVRLAVIAHIRHAQTPYDDLLLQGWDRHEARAQVRDAVDAVLRDWAA
ncbi:DUF2293 domain-containing protein [uncultured Thiohalocapsa sp.]|uniref:DUF2293 domain-containing protein n=1 Tax=uncultured Thiohalocapsa sp. TaxID=768990 RepID=UPI0025EFE6B2|nr:DUF2293 domain-containing protein [uncultured Thiohalocapsa sp.]